MKIISETSLDRFEAWSGGRDTLDVLIEKDLCDQLEAMLENDIFPDGCTDTELNDLLWFERDTIAEWLGFSDWDELENGSEEDEEDEDEEHDVHEGRHFQTGLVFLFHLLLVIHVLLLFSLSICYSSIFFLSCLLNWSLGLGIAKRTFSLSSRFS